FKPRFTWPSGAGGIGTSPAKGPALRLVPIAETAGKSQTGYRHSRTPFRDIFLSERNVPPGFLPGAELPKATSRKREKSR
ncbi:hypothetical protein, partial [Caldifermentibacillus hisashii]|uniref:hypothetical protein n=1 Tax=Caldifermentibacillus hisashii TaxID=996558 RepID=UPI001B35779E